MKIKRCISILCCIALMFTLLSGNSSAAELWNQNGEGIIAASEAATDSTGSEIKLDNVALTLKNGTVIQMEPLEADPSILVASEGTTNVLQYATITGSFPSSSAITITVANPVYMTEAGVWTVTKQPNANNGEFAIYMNYALTGAVALTLDAVAENGEKKTYTLVFERRGKCDDPEKISLLSADEYIDLGEDLRFSSITNETSRVGIYEVDADTNAVVVQAFRDIEKRDEMSTSLSWMIADQNYVSINGAAPVRFDSASSDDTEACSPELNLKKGVNVISLSFRNAVPKTYDFGLNSRGLYFTASNASRGYENFVFLVTYEGEEEEGDSPSDDSFLSSIEVTQFTTSATSTPQKAYASKLTENGYEHSVALPEVIPSLTDKKYYYYENDNQNNPKTFISHETIILGLKTNDPNAKAEVIDSKVYAPNNAIIYDNKSVTYASISMIDGTVYGEQYTAANLWNKDEIQVRATTSDGSEKIHTIKIVRASSAADITALSISGGNLALEDSSNAAFSSKTYEYYLDVDQEAIDNNALSFSVSISSGASINVDDEDVQAGELPLDASLPLHRIIVTASDGITQNTYLFLTRVDEEIPLLQLKDETKIYTGKMLEGWNSRTNAEKKDLSDSYWELYKTIATMDPAKITSRKEILHALSGSYIYDVTKHNFRQATDYSAVILELVMLGENPYDYKGANYVADLLSEADENHNFGAFANNIWALMALKAAGADIPDVLITSVKNQAMNSSGDLDMRGWAMAAVKDYMTPLEISKWSASIKDTQLTSGNDAGMFKHPDYNTINTMTHGCVLTGIAGAGIDVQNSLYTLNGTVTPLTALKNNYMTEDGEFYYSSAGFPSYSKDVIIALGDVLHDSNVWQRCELTAEKFGELLANAKTMLDGTGGTEAERKAVSDALSEAEDDSSTSGGAIAGLGKDYYALYKAMSSIDEDMNADVVVGSPLEQFSSMIEALPNADVISAEDKTDLETAKDFYESLPETYQKSIDSNILNKYRSCQSAVILLEGGTEAENVFKLILALPDALIITLDDKDQVKDAREAYNVLTMDQQAWLTWAGASVLNRLVDAEEMIKKLETPGNTKETTTVTFSLLGGSKHGDSKTVYAYSKNPGKFDVWIPETSYTFNSSSVTVYQVFIRAINEHALDQAGAQGNYVSAIMGPDGKWLKEFDNGANSGWMYLVNGTHPSVGLKDCKVSNGDVIIWHYTDDYTQEEGSMEYSSGSKSVTNKVSEAVTLQAKVDASGKATASVSAKDMSSALANVLKVAKATGKTDTIAEIKLDVAAGSSAKSVEMTVPTSSVKEVAKAGNTALTVATPTGNISFDQKALSAISEEAAGSSFKITIGKADTSKLSETQRQAISDRPVYELNLTSGDQTIIDFGGGKVSVTLPYTLAAGETAENICIYFVDGNVGLISIEGAKYDEKTGMVIFTTGHFSYYVIGYQATDKFTDVKSSSWFYDNVMYLVNEGVIKGKGDNMFAPNDSITRAEFVQILYSMAQAEADSTGSAVASNTVAAAESSKAETVFKDVKSAAWYGKAVTWAYENGVAAGVAGSDGTLSFAPNANISRQDMAVMIQNFTNKIEKKGIAATVPAAVFTDESDIEAYAKEAVSLMQQGGIINGISKMNAIGDTMTVFSPKNCATRAEAVTMIARLLKQNDKKTQ